MYLIHLLILLISILCGWAFSRWLVKLAYLRGYRDGLRRGNVILAELKPIRIHNGDLRVVGVARRFRLPSVGNESISDAWRTSTTQVLAHELAEHLLNSRLLNFVILQEEHTARGTECLVRTSILVAPDPSDVLYQPLIYQKPEIFRPDRPITNPPCPNHK